MEDGGAEDGMRPGGAEDGRWDIGYGIWDMGYGIWDMGYGNQAARKRRGRSRSCGTPQGAAPLARGASAVKWEMGTKPLKRDHGMVEL
jgi:hypothetical protein